MTTTSISNFLNNLTVVLPVNDDMTCSICHKIMMEPMIGKCGCGYCRNCIRTRIESNSLTCPGLKVECSIMNLSMSDDIVEDEISKQKIEKLIFCCPYEPCPSKYQLEGLKDHMKTCHYQRVDCPFVEFGCEISSVSLDLVKKHLNEKQSDHLQLLMSAEVNIRNDIRHLKNVEIAEMKKKMTGQINQSESQEVTKVIVTGLESKTFQTLREMVNFERVLKTEMTKMKNILDNNNGHLERDSMEIPDAVENHFYEQIDEIRCAIEEKMIFLQRINEAKDTVNQFKIETIETKMKETEEYSNCLKTLQNTVRRLIADVEMIDSPLPSSKDGFQWKIDDINMKLVGLTSTHKHSIDSPRFYSSPSRYCLCLRAYLNGCNDNKGTHLSLYFVICQGIFDEILTWPMKKKIIVSLVNQKTGQNVYDRLYQYDSVPERFRSSLEKPISEENKEYGDSDFIGWDVLNSKKDVFSNDAIVINCSVID